MSEYSITKLPRQLEVLLEIQTLLLEWKWSNFIFRRSFSVCHPWWKISDFRIFDIPRRHPKRRSDLPFAESITISICFDWRQMLRFFHHYMKRSLWIFRAWSRAGRWSDIGTTRWGVWFDAELSQAESMWVSRSRRIRAGNKFQSDDYITAISHHILKRFALEGCILILVYTLPHSVILTLSSSL